MNEVSDYKKKILAVDKSLKRILDRPVIDRFEVNKLEDSLDEVAQQYEDDEAIGALRYKLYEIMAYIHFLKGGSEKSLMFIDEAEKIRGREYLESRVLRNEVERQYSMNYKIINAAVRQKAIEQIFIGVAWLVIGGIITGISYHLSQQHAEEQAYSSGQTSYSFAYWAMPLAIIIGGYQLVKGLYLLATSKQQSNKIIKK